MFTRLWSSPRDWSLRVRLTVVLLVPGILAVILGGLRIADQTGEAAELDRVARFATAQGEVATLVERVAQERYRSTVFVAEGRPGDAAALQASFGEIEAVRAAIGPTLEALYADDPTLAGAVRRADQALSRLGDVRALTLTSKAPPSAVVARYSGLVDQLVELDGTLLRGVNTTEVNGLATALAGLSAARNEASLQSALATATGATTELLASDARMRSALADFRTALDPGQRVRYAALIAGPANTARAGLVQGLLANPDGRPTELVAAAPDVFGAVLAEIDATEDGVRAELAATGEERRAAATNLAGINAVLLLLALLIGALIVGLIARAMIRSLRVLRASAMEVAERRLPEAVQAMREGNVPDVDVEPVPVTSREEVGEVARAFDAVHTQAVRLAAEQATLQINVNRMFVNLSRRSQTLVDRQLQLIEELEKGEQDPDQLSNLFRLDHLATRMRRNSENLLVLAGTDLAKRSAQHVPLIDVLQAAVSEVERYERVTVEQPPAMAVVGRAANDVQHLLSELIDNATNFSPPDAQVRMTCTLLTSGPLVIEITDVGVGMPAHELLEANRQLGRRSEVTVNASRRMGLFVVGRLASRHGIEVRLVTGAGLTQARVQRGGIPVSITEDAGLTARVTVPAHLTVGADMMRLPGRPEARPEPMAFAGSGFGSRSTSARPGLSSVGASPPSSAPPRTAQASTAQMDPPRIGSTQVGSTQPGSAQPGSAQPGSAQPSSAQPGWAQPGSAQGAAAQGVAGVGGLRPTEFGSGRAPSGERPQAEAGRTTPSFPPRPTSTSRPSPDDPRSWWNADGLPAGTATEGASGASRDYSAPPDRNATPIFEEVTSGWFRSYREVPINWQDTPQLPTAGDPPAAVPAPRDELPTPGSATPDGPADDAARLSTAPVTGSASAPGSTSTPDTASGPGSASAPGSTSSSDDAARRPEPGGLPRRTPGAQLVPGRVPDSGGQRPPRDAGSVRGRLSDYQRGTRGAREDAGRDTPVDATSGGDSTPTQ